MAEEARGSFISCGRKVGTQEGHQQREYNRMGEAKINYGGVDKSDFLREFMEKCEREEKFASF